MALRVFASAWGNATHWGSLRRLMDGLQFKGFAGLEASLLDLGKDTEARKDVATQARDRGLELIVGLYSHWTDYEGTWAPARPGGAPRPIAEAGRRLRGAGPDTYKRPCRLRLVARGRLDAILRGRASSSPGERLLRDASGAASGDHAFQCQRILDAVPGLRLTADPSHWHVVHERFLDMDAVAGRVDHVHARVGNEERPQLAAPFDDAAADWHVAFWRRCWDAGARTACVEYGPAPYQATGDFRDLWLQGRAAKDHIEDSAPRGRRWPLPCRV